MSRQGPGWWRELRRAVAWHRRLLAAGFAAAAVALALSVLEPAPPATESVVAVGRDLPAGAVVQAADVTEVRLPPAAVPAGVVRSVEQVAGRVVAGPVRAGEPLTDVRLVGPSLLAGASRDVVAAPVRIADAAAARLLRPGDVIDVLAAEASTPGLGAGVGAASAGAEASTGGDIAQAPTAVARVLARGVRVLTVPSAVADGEEGLGSADLTDGALLVLATSGEVAASLASAAVTARLSVVLKPG